MVMYTTFTVKPARAKAWVNAAHVDACLGRRTFRTLNTFRSAVDVWITEIIGHAFTRTSTVSILADRVRTARGRIAWVNYFVPFNSYEKCITLGHRLGTVTLNYSFGLLMDSNRSIDQSWRGYSH